MRSLILHIVNVMRSWTEGMFFFHYCFIVLSLQLSKFSLIIPALSIATWRSLIYLQDIESGSNVVDGSDAETGHVIATTIRGRNGLPKQVRVIFLAVSMYIWCLFMKHIQQMNKWFVKQSVTYIAEHVVGTGSFGVVYQVKISDFSHFLDQCLIDNEKHIFFLFVNF